LDGSPAVAAVLALAYVRFERTRPTGPESRRPGGKDPGGSDQSLA